MRATWLAATLVLVAVAGWTGPAGAQARVAPAPVPKSGTAATAARGETCAGCHLQTGDERLERPAKLYDGDIHKAKGFGCVACHGGDGRAEGPEAMDPAKGYIGKPTHRQTVEVCGRCHSDARFMKRFNPALRVDQVAEYATSVHGRRLRAVDDQKVATCSSCHPAHTIKPRSDPASSVHPLHVADTCGRCHANAAYMEQYKIPTDQLEKYKKSVHWKTMSVKGDLSAPSCNSCHGNHGAAPPGVGWVGNVCGQCHTVMADLFAKSAHAKAFAQMGAPGCATCHNNHDIEPAGTFMVGLGDKAVCSNCHSPDDKGGKTAVGIRTVLDTLRTDNERAREILEHAEHAGMEVSQARFDLAGANDALVKARTAVHAFTLAAVKKEAEPGVGISTKAYERGVRALAELKFRRQGLGVSLVVILALLVGLVLKIRQVDRRPPPPAGGH